jgi:hypothetical protein
MKKAIILVCMFIFVATIASAAGSKTYMISGTITDVKGDVFTIQKDNVKYEMIRDAEAKVNGDLKIGSKATVVYKMTATTIAVSEDKKAGAKTNK